MSPEEKGLPREQNDPAVAPDKRPPAKGFNAYLLRLQSYHEDPAPKLAVEVLLFWTPLILLGYAITIIFQSQRSSLLTMLEFTGIPLVSTLLSLALLHKGRVRPAAIILCFGLMAGLVFSTYHAGGLSAPGIFALVIPFVIAGFTLERGFMFVLLVIATAYISTLAMLESTHRLPPATIPPTPANRAVIYLLVSGCIGWTTYWLTRRIEHNRLELNKEIEDRIAAEREALLLTAELEDRVRDRTADLDAFTAMVAHDLRTPVLHVNSYSRLLQEKGDVYDEESKFFVSRLAHAATNMGELIEDLLEFSRRQREKLDTVDVDMTALAESVRADLAESGKADAQWIQVEALPDAASDKSLVRQVWVNLLENAVKYSRHRAEPKIRVFAEIRNGVVWYVVEDNGMGFDPSEAVEIFKPFHRVHADTDIPGTGVGLSSVRRIVDRLGGRVIAEGEPDKGAKFAFTLRRS
jgi:signal transduction histidine kinase